TPPQDSRATVTDQDEASLRLLHHRVPRARFLPLDAADRAALARAMQEQDSVVSALAYTYNPRVPDVALELGPSYFDLTEDRETTRRVRDVAARARAGQVFVPQCG